MALPGSEFKSMLDAWQGKPEQNKLLHTKSASDRPQDEYDRRYINGSYSIH